MTARTAAEERRSGVRLLVAGGIVLLLMLGAWWLVVATNPSGEHDAELLPLLALIPLGLGLFRLLHARSRP